MKVSAPSDGDEYTGEIERADAQGRCRASERIPLDLEWHASDRNVRSTADYADSIDTAKNRRCSAVNRDLSGRYDNAYDGYSARRLGKGSRKLRRFAPRFRVGHIISRMTARFVYRYRGRRSGYCVPRRRRRPIEAGD